MNKTIIAGISILVLIVASITFFKGEITGDATIQQISLGYCPTMKAVAENIANNNQEIVLVQQHSSAQALQELNNKNIDVALIGRKAEQNEVQTTNEKVLGEGYTLVTNAKKFIQENNLESIKVHTAIAEDVARELLPNSEILFYSTTQDAVTNGLSEAVLIDWKDYKDEYELLVVMKGTQKVEDLRIPVLYSNNYDLEKLKVEI
jgi:hypothetical protein